MTRISGTGTWIEAVNRDREPCKGFTLIELVIVMAVIGAALALVFPRLDFSGPRLDSEARRLAMLIRHLDDSANSKKFYYRIWFRLDNERVDVEVSVDGLEYAAPRDDKAFLAQTFRHGTDLEDVTIEGMGKVSRGEAAVVFSPGASRAFNVHLNNSGKSLTISYNPYSGRVKVLDHRI
ncbi:MAG: prepilin-type N-terminal cleavage/methylation domain-containing protein [Deltaproteobacteria bacterium]|nr:prepilin-type N-terminal cleavage/methylation domain-containing protein [Deltaproteobacteria bacterium]